MRRKLELKEITENATVLKQMLDQLEEDQNKDDAEEITEDALATLRFLYESCQKLQPTTLILIGDTEDNDCLGSVNSWAILLNNKASFHTVESFLMPYLLSL